jgi:hypothetical protein
MEETLLLANDYKLRKVLKEKATEIVRAKVDSQSKQKSAKIIDSKLPIIS